MQRLGKRRREKEKEKEKKGLGSIVENIFSVLEMWAPAAKWYMAMQAIHAWRDKLRAREAHGKKKERSETKAGKKRRGIEKRRKLVCCYQYVAVQASIALFCCESRKRDAAIVVYFVSTVGGAVRMVAACLRPCPCVGGLGSRQFDYTLTNARSCWFPYGIESLFSLSLSLSPTLTQGVYS